MGVRITNFTKGRNSYVNYANKGLLLEEDINITNEYYINTNIALVYKKPTPIKIVKVDYPNRSMAKIKEGFFEKPSTLDYCGVYKGYYLDFDAKECNSKTSFPLANIHNHQIKHIQRVIEHGGISFIIVRFNILDKIYLLFGEDLLHFINNNDRKSIPVDYFNKCGHTIDMKYIPRIDYIKVIDNYIKLGGSYDKKKKK